MAQVVASHWDGIDVLASALARLKQHMLEHYAAGQGLVAERHWERHADSVVVSCDEQQVLGLLGTLHNKGCTDLHVYSDDPVTRSLVEGGPVGPYGYFRVCVGRWPAPRATEGA